VLLRQSWLFLPQSVMLGPSQSPEATLTRLSARNINSRGGNSQQQQQPRQQQQQQP